MDRLREALRELREMKRRGEIELFVDAPNHEELEERRRRYVKLIEVIEEFLEEEDYG